MSTVLSLLFQYDFPFMIYVQDKTWTEFSILEVATCRLCNLGVISKTAWLKVANSAQITSRFSPVSYHTPHYIIGHEFSISFRSNTSVFNQQQIDCSYFVSRCQRQGQGMQACNTIEQTILVKYAGNNCHKLPQMSKHWTMFKYRLEFCPQDNSK